MVSGQRCVNAPITRYQQHIVCDGWTLWTRLWWLLIKRLIVCPRRLGPRERRGRGLEIRMCAETCWVSSRLGELQALEGLTDGRQSSIDPGNCVRKSLVDGPRERPSTHQTRVIHHLLIWKDNVGSAFSLFSQLW